MTRDFFAQLQAMIAEHWPGTAAIEVRIKLTTGQKVTLPVPMVAPAATVAPAAAKPLTDRFVPNAIQKAILEALDGVAMRTSELESVPGLANRIFKKRGGISELKEAGLVQNHSRLGFFRPDAPPPELTDDATDDDDDDDYDSRK